VRAPSALVRRAAAAVALLAVALPAAAQVKVTRRLEACAEVVQEVVDIPEGIPADLLEKAECVIVIPSVKKFALGVGGRFGRGAVTCRTPSERRPWGAPLMVSIGGGSIGAQIGGQAADYVLLIMNPKGIDNLLKSKFTLGADATIAAGPKGRALEAGTDARMRAEILSYSRTRGLFAGISLEGAVLKQDKDANVALYGEAVDPRALVTNPKAPDPAAGRPLVELLVRLSPRPGTR
jgi:lipid-binding SYLF domain-containing protein